jgi:hypothetical protein
MIDACMKRISISGAAAAVLAAALWPATAAGAPQRITLTQVPCQFLESEGVDRGYTTRSIRDCEAINAKTGEKRLTEAKTIRLKPGKYEFHVVNKNVPYELGFWLRGATLLSRARLPSVSGGGIMPGGSRTYEIELKAGEYVYSCPLNPTPDYALIVQ